MERLNTAPMHSRHIGSILEEAPRSETAATDSFERTTWPSRKVQFRSIEASHASTRTLRTTQDRASFACTTTAAFMGRRSCGTARHCLFPSVRAASVCNRATTLSWEKHAYGSSLNVSENAKDLLNVDVGYTLLAADHVTTPVHARLEQHETGCNDYKTVTRLRNWHPKSITALLDRRATAVQIRAKLAAFQRSSARARIGYPICHERLQQRTQNTKFADLLDS
jgi:hypothetical protein